MKDKKVIIFGGGEVGFRKASFFYPEADVSVVSRTFCEKFKSTEIKLLEKDLKNVSDAYIKDIISGCAVVVAATSDRELNNRIGNISNESKVLFNNADGNEGNIMIPSRITGKNYQISISTGGKSPGMSKYIRGILEKECQFIDEMIEIQNDIRGILKSEEPDQKRRNAILSKIINDKEVWKKLETDKDSVKKYIQEKYL